MAILRLQAQSRVFPLQQASQVQPGQAALRPQNTQQASRTQWRTGDHLQFGNIPLKPVEEVTEKVVQKALPSLLERAGRFFRKINWKAVARFFNPIYWLSSTYRAGLKQSAFKQVDQVGGQVLQKVVGAEQAEKLAATVAQTLGGPVGTEEILGTGFNVVRGNWMDVAKTAWSRFQKVLA